MTSDFASTMTRQLRNQLYYPRLFVTATVSGFAAFLLMAFAALYPKPGHRPSLETTGLELVLFAIFLAVGLVCAVSALLVLRYLLQDRGADYRHASLGIGTALGVTLSPFFILPVLHLADSDVQPFIAVGIAGLLLESISVSMIVRPFPRISRIILSGLITALFLPAAYLAVGYGSLSLLLFYGLD